MDVPEIEARNIVKTFPGVRALRGVDFTLRSGEVHGLVGENGAGKSTLMNVLAGVLRPDAGEIRRHGEPLHHLTPHEAQRRGIGFIRQDPHLIPDLTVAENITLGAERHRWGVVSNRAGTDTARRHLAELGIEVDAAAPVRHLSPAQRQLVAVAKALFHDPQVLILDEPTAPLTASEQDLLFTLIRRLVADGKSAIYITHRLEEVFELADRATVLRDGARVDTVDIGSGIGRDDLVRLMVGRELTSVFPPRNRQHDVGREPVLVLHGLLARQRPAQPDLQVRAGEILGVAGLVGSGRSELLRSIFGSNPAQRMTVTIDGRTMTPTRPRDAIRAGVALVPEDRRGAGLVGLLDIRENVTLAAPRSVSRLGRLNGRREYAVTTGLMRRLNVKAYGPGQVVANLSGGNQQKVVLAKWLLTTPKVLLLDEPTNGIDVGARAEIYRQIIELADSGQAVVLVSSELPEILGLADRIVVMRGGQVAAYLDREHADQESILHAAFGREQS